MRLIIGNSFCKLEGFTSEGLKPLRSLLSYRITGSAAYYAQHNPIRHLMTAKGQFPTGLLSRVYEYFSRNNLHGQIELVDSRRVPEASKALFTMSNYPTPYPEQEAACIAAIALKRGIVSACTGGGKSLMMALLINKLQLRTLVVVPNLTLKRQLKEVFTGYFGSLGNITIENIDSKALTTAKDYDVLIIDEAHHVSASTYQQLNKTAWQGIYHRYHFTATPFRNNPDENLLFEALAGDLAYSLPYKTAVAKGYVALVEAYYVDLPKRPVEGYTWAEVYGELVVRNEERNLVILDLLDKLKGKSTLCLVKEIAHGARFEAEDYTFVKGENEDNEATIADFNSERIKTLIATTGCLGEGADTKPAEYVIITGLGKAKGAFMQQVGRALRAYKGKESAKVIIFRDSSHKWTLAHFNAQKKILKDEFGIVPIKLSLTSE